HAAADQHLLPSRTGAGGCGLPAGGRARGERRRGSAGLRSGPGARRNRALLFLRHLHLLRQLRALLPRPRGEARGRRLRRPRRLLQGLRPVRAGVSDGLDEDGGGRAMKATEVHDAQRTLLLTGNHAVAWAARLARPKVVPLYPITPQTPVLEKI